MSSRSNIIEWFKVFGLKICFDDPGANSHLNQSAILVSHIDTIVVASKKIFFQKIQELFKVEIEVLSKVSFFFREDRYLLTCR